MHIWGARGGSLSVAGNNFVNLKSVPEEKLKLLLHTPSSAIGTSRDQLSEKDYDDIADSLIRNKIGIVCYNGGNGSMDEYGHMHGCC